MQKTKKKLTRAQRRHRRKVRRVTWRVALSVLTLIGLVLVAALCAGQAAFNGPSQTVGDLLTVSMLETSALKFVPRIFYSQEKVDEVVARNSVSDDTGETDTSLIVVAKPTPEPQPGAVQPDDAGDAGDEAAQAAVQPAATPEPQNLLSSEDGIEVYSVKSGTYNGYMMVVLDPARVTVGTCRDKFNGERGLQLKDIAKRYDALAAINGGGFEDTGGVGNGGTPVGLVVAQGKLMHTGKVKEYNITVGFNQDNIMILAKNMTKEEAQEKGIRDAITFGPALVVNGEPVAVKGASSGLNPRTAIGQRADGAVLMLVIEGRQASSLGATYADLISIMLEYGAINAINMDGGSSSLMYYKGEYVNNGVVLTGSRTMPTAFIVR